MNTASAIARRLLPVGIRQAIRRVRPIAWSRGESNVALAIHDLVRPGDTVFDFGANAGEYTVMMSKLVGPSGRVYAFEANPRLAERTRERLVSVGASNCALVEAAVADREGEIDFFLDPRDGAPASTIMTSLATESRLGESFQRIKTRAITLDVFCEQHRLTPSFVKIDIEGAEELAVRGFEKTLSTVAPHVLFELGGSNGPTNSCMEFLGQRAYRLVDLSTFEWANPGRYVGRAFLTDILALHSTRLSETPYAGMASTHLGTASGQAWLESGRYRAVFQAS